MMFDAIRNFKAMDWETVEAGLKSKTIMHDDVRLRLVEFSAGFEERDWCRGEHYGLLIEGELELQLPGGIFRAFAGDAVVLPPVAECRHKARSLTPTALLFLVERLSTSQPRAPQYP
jgi:hypothetical protein